jgi:hypothetical protein
MRMALITFAVLAACTSPRPSVVDQYDSETPSIDHFTFSTTMLSSQSPPLANTINETVTGYAAQAIYEATLALPLPDWGSPSMPINECPIWGGGYQLEFFAGSQTMLTANTTWGVCVLFDLSGSDGDVTLAASDSRFWSELAGALDLPETAIWPYPKPT